MKTLGILAGIHLAIGLTGGAAFADTIRLTVAAGYPPTAAWVNQFEEVFVPEVERRLAVTGEHSIDWNLAWGTIVNPGGEFDAVESGMADIGIVQTVFHPDKVGIYNIAYVTPFTSTDIEAISATVNGLADRFPAMTDIWTRYGQHMLTTLAAVDDYQIILRETASGPADLAGRKLCGAGLNLRYIEGQGVVGVPSPLSDWYNNIRSGICDGTIAWPEAIMNFKLVEVAPFLLDVSFGGVNSMALTVNLRKWAALPEEVRTVLTEVAEEYRVALARYSEDRSALSIETYVEGGGEIIPLDETVRRNWAESIPPIAAEWVTEQTAAGFPARDILAAYMDAMATAGAEPLRDWRE